MGILPQLQKLKKPEKNIKILRFGSLLQNTSNDIALTYLNSKNVQIH